MDNDLAGILKRFSGQRILVLGDVILDWYWWGQASRLSPEAPVPVVRKQRATTLPGGAGNTAANLAALGAKVTLFGVTGQDAQAAELRSALEKCGVETGHLFVDPSRPTTTKTRVIAAHQQVVRIDEEYTEPVAAGITQQAVTALKSEHADAIVVSDYAKGFVTRDLLQPIVQHNRVFVDPKGSDFTRYLGAFLLKPNRLELGLLTNMPVENHADVIAAGRKLASQMPRTHILVTEGGEGMTRFFGDQAPEHFEATPRQVFDVTGAGDTVLATLAMAVTAGASWGQAMQLATHAAGIAIGRMGSVAVSISELEASIS